MRTRLASVVLIALATGFNCNCADYAYSQAYNEHVSESLDAYRFQGDLDTVRTEAAGMLRDKGYAIAETSGGSSLTTQWRSDLPDVRHEIHVQLEQDGGIKFGMIRREQSMSPQKWEAQSRRRADEIEAALLLKLHPPPATEATPTPPVDMRTTEQVRAFVYERPAHEIWDELTAVVSGEGHLLPSSESVDALTTSMWNDSEDRLTRDRYEARLVKRAEGKYQVEVYIAVEKAVGDRHWEPASEQPQPLLALDLLRRLDAPAATEIDRVAEEKGQAAFDDALARGGVSCGGCGNCQVL